MRIRVADKNFGECVVEVHSSIDKSDEYVIKSLCMLQLMCMNKEDYKDKNAELISIIQKAVNEISELYTDQSTENTAHNCDPTDQFGD